MKHRGEIFKKIADHSGLTREEIADGISVSVSKLYRLFEDPNIPFDLLIKAGKVLKHDFSEEFRELANPEKLKALEENLNYKLKYFELIEKYNILMEEQVAYLKKKRK